MNVFVSASAVCVGVFFFSSCSCHVQHGQTELILPLSSSLAASCLCTRYSWRWPNRHTTSSCCGSSPRPSPGACPRRRERKTPPHPREKPTRQASTTDAAAVASFPRESQGLTRGTMRGIIRETIPGTIPGTTRGTIRGTRRGMALRQARPSAPSGGTVAGAWRRRLMVRGLRRGCQMASAGEPKGLLHLPPVSGLEERNSASFCWGVCFKGFVFLFFFVGMLPRLKDDVQACDAAKQ